MAILTKEISKSKVMEVDLSEIKDNKGLADGYSWACSEIAEMLKDLGQDIEIQWEGIGRDKFHLAVKIK